MAEKGFERMPDVLIVGAGASGAVAAKRLAEEGFDVVCLEQGGWPDYSKARAPYPDYELTSGRDWGWDPNARSSPADYPVDDSESDITALKWNGVGGGTVVFAAHWQRNLPSDFRVRSLDGVADDWPFTYEDLEPYYVRAERDWGVSGLAGDTAFPPGEGPPMPPGPARQDGTSSGEGAQRSRLALVARTERDRDPSLRQAQPVHAARHLFVGLLRRREGQRRPNLLAGGGRKRGHAAHGCEGEAPVGWT